MTERHHALDGCLNLRDVGGYLTAEGRQVRWGCLYRSGELCSLTDADLDAVGRLGVRVVVDLRNRWERVARPGRLPPGVELVERPSPPTGRARGRTLEEQIVTGDLPVKDDETSRPCTSGCSTAWLRRSAWSSSWPSTPVERPVLFHCVAGKDRAGPVAAVLLGAPRRPEATIVEDYELTTTHYASRRLAALAPLLATYGVAETSVRHLVEARRPALEGALRHLHRQWGGYDGYLTAAGARPGLPARLRAALTTAATAEPAG